MGTVENSYWYVTQGPGDLKWACTNCGFLAGFPFPRFSSHCFKDFFRYEEIECCTLKSELFSDLKLTNSDEFLSSLIWGQIQSPWVGDKVDSGIGLPMVNVLRVDSGVDIRWAYSQLRHRVPHTPCFSLDSASERLAKPRVIFSCRDAYKFRVDRRPGTAPQCGVC